MSDQEFVVISGSAPGPEKAAIPTAPGIGVPPRVIATSNKMPDETTGEDEHELMVQLEQLRQEHRDLDAAIEALVGTIGVDRLQIQRLKKRKLMLRDRIVRIEDQLTPDIIA